MGGGRWCSRPQLKKLVLQRRAWDDSQTPEVSSKPAHWAQGVSNDWVVAVVFTRGAEGGMGDGMEWRGRGADRWQRWPDVSTGKQRQKIW